LAGDWLGLAMVVLAGTIWTIQRQVCNNLAIPLITHLTYNLTLVVIALAEKLFN